MLKNKMANVQEGGVGGINWTIYSFWKLKVWMRSFLNLWLQWECHTKKKQVEFTNSLLKDMTKYVHTRKQLVKIRNNLLKQFWQFWKITINRL